MYHAPKGLDQELEEYFEYLEYLKIEDEVIQEHGYRSRAGTRTTI
ncbi:hypothetical protein [Desulfoscipio gibsoniae]|nr:hypothetical protein [Desulfoscipio gibsoniae]